MSVIVQLLKEIKYNFRLAKIRSNHRKRNKHNFTIVGHGNYSDNIYIGKNTYGELNYNDFQCGCKLKIGSYCSLAKGVTFLMGGGHNYNNISSYPFKNKIKHIQESTSKGDIIIDDDVWIGYGAIILSGVHIGQGAVIGAGSVVAKDVPPYAIYAGGKIIKYRFSEEIIGELMKIDFSKLSFEQVISHMDLFYKPVDINSVEECKNLIKK